MPDALPLLGSIAAQYEYDWKEAERLQTHAADMCRSARWPELMKLVNSPDAAF
jgi:hypothetical protein